MHIHPRSSPEIKKLHSYDGIIEAVRRDESGRVVTVRYYPRHGAGFSDVFIMTREELIQALENKKKFAVGARIRDMGGHFNLGGTVKLQGSGEKKRFIVTGDDKPDDGLELPTMPLF